MMLVIRCGKENDILTSNYMKYTELMKLFYLSFVIFKFFYDINLKIS